MILPAEIFLSIPLLSLLFVNNRISLSYRLPKLIICHAGNLLCKNFSFYSLVWKCSCLFWINRQCNVLLFKRESTLAFLYINNRHTCVWLLRCCVSSVPLLYLGIPIPKDPIFTFKKVFFISKYPISVIKGSYPKLVCPIWTISSSPRTVCRGCPC